MILHHMKRLLQVRTSEVVKTSVFIWMKHRTLCIQIAFLYLNTRLLYFMFRNKSYFYANVWYIWSTSTYSLLISCDDWANMLAGGDENLSEYEISCSSSIPLTEDISDWLGDSGGEIPKSKSSCDGERGSDMGGAMGSGRWGSRKELLKEGRPLLLLASGGDSVFLIFAIRAEGLRLIFPCSSNSLAASSSRAQ